MIDLLVPAIVISIIAFVVVLVATPPLIKFLERKNLTVMDVNKKNTPQVARPGGISIIIGLLAAEFSLYLFLPLTEILAVIATTFAAFVIGFVDDRKIMSGWFKIIALVFAALPIIFFGAYDSNLTFPLFGDVQIPILYVGLILFIIPITGNTINSIDVLNGVASGFMAIASFSLFTCLIILQNYEVALISLPLAFYKFHKLPSKIFPGDSGALTFGAMYGSIAIVGEIEVIAAVGKLSIKNHRAGIDLMLRS